MRKRLKSIKWNEIQVGKMRTYVKEKLRNKWGEKDRDRARAINKAKEEKDRNDRKRERKNKNKIEYLV